MQLFFALKKVLNLNHKKMKIRKAIKEDATEIVNLSKKLQKEVINNLPEELIIFDAIMPKSKLLERIDNENYLSLVVEEKGKIVGYCLNKMEEPYNENSPKQGKISELFILKEYRGKSIASKLYERSLEWFKKMECDYIQLNVYETNPAREIYKKWGFKTFSVNMKKKI